MTVREATPDVRLREPTQVEASWAYLPVCANVQHDGEALVGLDARQGCIEGQFAHGDAHAVGPKVPKAEDALPIGHTDSPHVALRPGGIN